MISVYQKLSNEFRNKYNLKPVESISLEEYTNKHNLLIKNGYLYAFRDHDFNGSGIFRYNI